MTSQDFFNAAIERVLALDLPDELCGQAIGDEADRMAGGLSDTWTWEPVVD